MINALTFVKEGVMRVVFWLKQRKEFGKVKVFFLIDRAELCIVILGELSSFEGLFCYLYYL